MGRLTFVYKIESGIDGFEPRRVFASLSEGAHLDLAWARQGSAATPGDEVWVHVHAPPQIPAGVYLKGVVASSDRSLAQVRVQVNQLSVDKPLDDPAIVRAVAQLPAAGYEQVFMLLDERSVVQLFSLHPASPRHRTRHCGLPIIRPRALAWPPRLSCHYVDFAPAFWVLPADSFVHLSGRDVRPEVEAASALCLRFKFGEPGLADALAVGVYEALAARNLVRFDFVTPIPLSPEKAAAGRPHIARAVSLRLARLLETDVFELLSLKRPISKGARRVVDGLPASEFEAEYAETLEVDGGLRQDNHLLIVDDICHEGSTLSAALKAVRSACGVVAVAAAVGQIATRAAVRDQESLLA